MKIFLAYSILFIVVLLTKNNILPYQLKNLLIPFTLLTLTFLFSDRLKLKFNWQDLFFGLKTTFYILLIPLLVFFLFFGGITYPSPTQIIYLAFAVAIPEEMFFRGFIQERFGNNWKAIIITSLLFSIAHIPNLIFHGDYLSPLTFFPSLIMGWLYMKRSNLLPSIIFHLFANLFYNSISFNFMLK